MRYMSSYIEIGNLVFRNKVNAVEIVSAWSEITRTATIKFPRFKKLMDPQITNYKIKPGDPVLIRLGYNDQLQTEFEGYVSEILPQTPIVIKCEDEMWKLKQQTVSISWASITLKAALEYLSPGANVSTAYDITLQPFRLNQVTKAKALQKLKEDYNLVIYFRNKQLFAGLAYNESGMPEVNYHFQKNAKPENLVFRTKDQVKLKVKAVSILPNNERITVEVGDDDGDQRTLTFYNIESQQELERQANDKMELLKYDGFTGTFNAKGLPRVDHGYTANISDDRYQERNKRCFIDKVITTYDSDGFNRVITPGKTAF